MQAVKISELKRGDLFRWDPSALEKGESPETTWVVIEEGRALPCGGRTGVQVSPLGTGLTFVPINTVGWDWLAIPTGEHVAPKG